MFVASSLLHFNVTHRAGIVGNAPEQSSSASTSASVAMKPTSSGRTNAAGPLVSSSSRVVNTATTRALPTGNDLRNWMVQPGAHNDSPSKGKGKAKAVAPAEVQRPRPPIKLESGPVKLEPTSAVLPAVVRPKAKASSHAVKMEPSSTPSVSSRHPQVDQPVLLPIKPEPYTGPDWGMHPGIAMGHPPGGVKVENSSVRVPGPLLPKRSPSSSPAHGYLSSSGPSLPSSSSAASSTSSPATPSGDASARSTAVKRRLGMGRATGGYTNKKFKPMMPGGS